VNIIDSPSYYFEAWVKASSKTLFESPLKRTIPLFPAENISPIVLSSNVTTNGLSCF